MHSTVERGASNANGMGMAISVHTNHQLVTFTTFPLHIYVYIASIS